MLIHREFGSQGQNKKVKGNIKIDFDENLIINNYSLSFYPDNFIALIVCLC
jgi:hypothetical protein